MIRLFCFSLVIALASGFFTQEQEKDPPKPFTNSIGMKFVWIPPGNFMMGSPKEEKERLGVEAQYKVTLSKGFYMGVYTVTQEHKNSVFLASGCPCGGI
jgi:formylglycine-generating enzyme required for sulfatase activity